MNDRKSSRNSSIGWITTTRREQTRETAAIIWPVMERAARIYRMPAKCPSWVNTSPPARPPT
ncbi:MAG: hypothetical protein KAR37_06000, partial [Alphaproteobacteria bacterium]|nr:hypothetical protein [Alphaproteobacteria bacterium]